jgi:hypothetical protein
MKLWTAALAAVAFLLNPQDDLKPGLIVEFYDMRKPLEDFPVVDAEKKPTLRRIDGQVNYDSTLEEFAKSGLSDHFYARWTGLLRVPKDAKYTFYAESDDGSRLWVSDKLVVDNGGLHAMEEKSGEVELKAGDHPIRIDLFENDGETGAKVSWEADGLPKEIIPEKAFFHKKDKYLDK